MARSPGEPGALRSCFGRATRLPANGALRGGPLSEPPKEPRLDAPALAAEGDHANCEVFLKAGAEKARAPSRCKGGFGVSGGLSFKGQDGFGRILSRTSCRRTQAS